jgi:phosphomethylpyrimidine synthase
MKVAQEVRECLKKMGIEEAAALKVSMDEKSKEFLEGGVEIYTPE